MNTVIKDTLRNIQLVETNRRFSIEGKDSKVYDYTDAILAATSFLPNSTTIRERVKLLLDDYDLLYDKNLSIIELMEKFAIKSNGSISTIMRLSHFDLLKRRIVADTQFLDESATIPQRWYHIKYKIYSKPKCISCESNVEWRNGYSKHCSNFCWHKSDAGREILSKLSTGNIRSEETRRKGALSNTGKHRTDEQKKSMSVKMKGNTNFLKNGSPWNKGLPTEMQPMYNKPGRVLRGKDNPMFGKTPSPNCGFGIKGYFNNKWFRSSLELFWLLYWHSEGHTVVGCENKEYRVQYTLNDKIRHYTPDFMVNGIIYEIKPVSRINEEIVLVKFNALKNKFSNSMIITELEIKEFLRDMDMNYIENLIRIGILRMSDKELKRLPNAILGVKTLLRRSERYETNI